MSELAYFTREGLEKLKEELHDYKTVKRAEIARAISEAREKGDLSENAEYDAAKEEQGLLELKIQQLEALLASARVLDENLDTSKVYILSKVKVKNLKGNQEMTYQLVSQKEADLKQGKISVDSPIGKALLGKTVGDVFEVQAPAGTIKFEILDISR
jgi:transcription elongation factor GreA